MIFFKKTLWLIFLALFCLALISIWFKDGKLLATGEEGLMLINPDRAIELYKYSWNELGIGVAIPGVNPVVPLFYLESLAVKSGIQIWIFQAVIFLILMFIGVGSIYFLTKEILRKYSNQLNLNIVALVAALFYVLNPVSLLGVWYRFLLAFMFFYALAPLFFYLYTFGLNHRKNSFVLLVPLIGLLFSFAFTGPSFVLLLWLLPFIYTISVGLYRSKGKLRFKYYPLVYFFLSIFFWVLINLWWLFPYIELSKIAFVSETDPIHAIGTLKANSKDFTLDNILRLIHGGILYRGESFGSIYKTVPFLILSWFIPIITFYGLLKLRSGVVKSFFVTSLILVLFLAKGTSPPFGQVFLWFFEKITFLQVYRNTFEKIGILLPIVYAPLFGYGLIYYLYKIENIKVRGFFFILVIFALGLNSWPFFTGAVVSFGDRDIRVEVPTSFTEANDKISERDHRILSIPVMGGASGFYKWRYGYKGVEAGEYLFEYPVITKFYDAKSFSGQLLIGMSEGKLDSNLVGIAQVFSADIIAYRKDTDIDAFGYNFDALERSEKMIKSSDLNMIYDSAEVSLWYLPKDKIVPLIYIPESIKTGDSAQDLITLIANKQLDPQKEVFICVGMKECILSSKLFQSTQVKIESFPEKISFNKISPVSYEIDIANSTGKFLLVFNSTYHPGWQVIINGKAIPSNNHIIVNGYANGFIIDKLGSFDMKLKFVPEEKIQKAYQFSIWAIGIGLGGLILFPFYSLLKKVFR